MLVVLAGLPGSGKSAVAEDLAQALSCAVLSVDPAEAAMWRAGVGRSEPTGLAAYVVVEALAAEQIALGHDVIVDAVNAVEAARAQWRSYYTLPLKVFDETYGDLVFAGRAPRRATPANTVIVPRTISDRRCSRYRQPMA